MLLHPAAVDFRDGGFGALYICDGEFSGIPKLLMASINPLDDIFICNASATIWLHQGEVMDFENSTYAALSRREKGKNCRLY